MGGNVFGELFRITTFGESHGGGVGVIVEGIPPLLPITETDIQKELDRRKPGQSPVTTPRKETDTVHILSGVFQGKTTGTPLAMIIYNNDTDPAAYEPIRKMYRPGHADYTYQRKYGFRDFRGSGRASGRETAGRVAAGAVAKKLLSLKGISITAYTLEAAGIRCGSIDYRVIERNSLRAPDMEAAAKMENRIVEAAQGGDSFGGIVECVVSGVPPGLGEPVFDKLDAELAKAMLSLGSVKGIEFGSGFAAAGMRGSEHNDEMDSGGFITNHAGGILGGISSGADIIFRVAVKPTSSIALPQRTVDLEGNVREIRTEGRHDPCICPRIVPVVEAMAAIVLEDMLLRQSTLIKEETRDDS